MSTTEDDNNNNHDKFDAAFNRIIEYRKILQNKYLRKTEKDLRMQSLLQHVHKTLKNPKIDTLESGVREAYDFHQMCVNRTKECGEKIKEIMKESEIGAAKALQVQILDYLNNYPLQDIRMAFHLTSKEVRHSEKNLPQVEFSNDLLEDTVAQFTAIGSSKSDRLRKLSGALIVLGSVMNPDYDLKSLEGPLPKVEPVIAEVLDELEKNCDQLLKMTKEEGKVDIMDKVESILISVMQHTKREMDKYKLNYDIAASISETYGLPLDFQLPSWLEPSYTNDY